MSFLPRIFGDACHVLLVRKPWILEETLSGVFLHIAQEYYHHAFRKYLPSLT
jgi:hypothetical protein